MQTIAFIGLGKMGGNMADRYLAAGHVVYGEVRYGHRDIAGVHEALAQLSPDTLATR
jgi:3-hydroxyisobutyrate dehydrogenase-like beta-hydroxyacid dehydrogenase